MRKIVQEFKSRLNFYGSDWTEPFTGPDVRHKIAKLISASVYVLVTSVAPAIAFASFVVVSTGGQYGVIEVLLSTGISGVIYTVFSGQPLVVMGVTGPISILSTTVYQFLQNFYGDRTNEIFLPFMFWLSLWACCFHIVISVFGLCDWVKYVSRFTCEVFGAYTGCVYMHTAYVQLEVQSHTTFGGLGAYLLCLVTFWFGWNLMMMRYAYIFTKGIRQFLSEYSVALCIICITGLFYLIPGYSQVPDLTLLPVPKDFQPQNGRSNWVLDLNGHPSELPALAIIPAMILTILVFFDHNVSSIFAQQPSFKLTKPPAYNLDFLVVGLYMPVLALLGLPFAHGLLPQAPLHTQALAKYVNVKDEQTGAIHREVEYVLEQRWSNLIQSVVTLLFVLIPAGRSVLSTIPVAVLSGLFLMMGFEFFIGNQFVDRLKLMFLVASDEDRMMVAPETYQSIKNIKKRNWMIYTLIQVVSLAVIVGITLSPAAIVFPVMIAILVPFRLFGLPRFMSAEALQGLDNDMSNMAPQVEDVVELDDLVGSQSSMMSKQESV